MDRLILSLLFISCKVAENAFVGEYIIDLSLGLGRRFDGIGAISGGGATSKLLVNYPEEQRNEILDFLFKPNFGASLQILKVEIGGDGQSSEGTESSHMHNSWDENYSRGYEWWLMKEAKKRNPHIKLYGLPWSFPGWLADGAWWPYRFPNRTSDYIVRWIQGAKKYHGLDIDYIGIWNEKPYEMEYVKVLRERLDEAGLGNVLLVVADLIGASSWNRVTKHLDDQLFNDSVAIIGAHYTGTSSTATAKASGKPLWSSEDYSAEDTNEGAGCFARLINQNYVNGLMTSTIAWNLIVSYYDNLPYRGHGLMTANQPWSGHYEVRGPIWSAAHTTQFTEIGWTYLKHESGVGRLRQGGSYVTLQSPDQRQLSIIVETMDTSDGGYCLRPPQGPYKVKAQNITFVIKGDLLKVDHFHVWQTKLGKHTEPSRYFENLGITQVAEGKVFLSAEVNSVYTLTTLSTGHKGQYSTMKPHKPFPLPYIDNFNSYKTFQEADNFAQQVGAFEIQESNEPQHGKVLQQVALMAPIHWCPNLQTQPTAVLGNYNWSDVTVEVAARIPAVNGTDGMFLAARVDQGGCTNFIAKGVYLFLRFRTQTLELSRDLALTQTIESKNFPVLLGQWYTLRLKMQGTSVLASVDGQVVFSRTVSDIHLTHGFVALGSENFGLADFDNFQVSAA